MAAPKKYYWLRLKRDFFKRHDTRIIESMENGEKYILFYLKLLVESIDHEGSLRFSDTIPYNEKMLATITNTDVDIVRSAVKLFVELDMMDQLDDGTLYMSHVNTMIGSETEWAEKKRNYRDGKQLTISDNDDIPETLSGQKRTLSDKRLELENREREREDKARASSLSADIPEPEKEARAQTPSEIPKYPEMVFQEWTALGDKVFQPSSLFQFLQTWNRDISQFVRGVHSDDVLAAIRNLGIIVSAPAETYYWKYRIGIAGFMAKHLERFLPANFSPGDFAPTLSYKGQEEAETAAAMRRVFGKEEAP